MEESVSPNVDLAKLISQVCSLRRYVQDGKQKPHKLLLLLAVLELMEEGKITENQVAFNKDLEDCFERAFRAFAESNDWCQPTIPFFHLRSSGFWFHRVQQGREEVYSRIRKMGASPRWIHDNIEYAYLSDAAFRVVSSAPHRRLLRQYVELLLSEE